MKKLIFTSICFLFLSPFAYAKKVVETPFQNLSGPSCERRLVLLETIADSKKDIFLNTRGSCKKGNLKFSISLRYRFTPTQKFELVFRNPTDCHWAFYQLRNLYDKQLSFKLKYCKETKKRWVNYAGTVTTAHGSWVGAILPDRDVYDYGTNIVDVIEGILVVKKPKKK